MSYSGHSLEPLISEPAPRLTKTTNTKTAASPSNDNKIAFKTRRKTAANRSMIFMQTWLSLSCFICHATLTSLTAKCSVCVCVPVCVSVFVCVVVSAAKEIEQFNFRTIAFK